MIEIYLISNPYIRDIRVWNLFYILIVNILIVLSLSWNISIPDILLANQGSEDHEPLPHSSAEGGPSKGDSSGPNGPQDDSVIIPGDSSNSGNTSPQGSDAYPEDWNDPNVCRCCHEKGNPQDPCPDCNHDRSVDLTGDPGDCCICGRPGANKICNDSSNYECECIGHDLCFVPGLVEDTEASSNEDSDSGNPPKKKPRTN